jgi:hypothetical protein
MVDKPDRVLLDPDKVRNVELCHQPHRVATQCASRVEYVHSEVRVLTFHKALLAPCA